MKFSAGIDLGGTFTKLALMDLDGKIVEREKTPSMIGASPQELLADVRRTLETMCARAHLPYPPTEGCGIGTPGVVDYPSGTVKMCGAFRWTDEPLREIATEVLSCPVAVDTDVNAGMLADLYFGHAATSSDVIYVSWGTGLGAGIAMARQIYHSRHGAMGNFGHTLAEPNRGRLCFCGIRGCLESEIGARALVANAQEAMAEGRASTLAAQDHLTPLKISLAAQAGDALSIEILGKAVTLLAHTLAVSLSMLNPDTVIFAGGVSNCLPLVRDVFDQELARSAPTFALDAITIRASAFNESAGVVGAAKLATLGRTK
jgi:glucokinase